MGTVAHSLTTMPPADNNKMAMQLTEWTDQDKEWGWFFDQQTERLYQRTNQGWKFHRKANIQAKAETV